MVAPWRIVSAQCSRPCWALRRAGDALLLLLLNIPEYRGRRGQNTADILAGSDRLIILAEMDVGDHLALAHLHGFGDLLLLGRIGGARESVAQPRDPPMARPAERRLAGGGMPEHGHH